MILLLQLLVAIVRLLLRYNKPVVVIIDCCSLLVSVRPMCFEVSWDLEYANEEVELINKPYL